MLDFDNLDLDCRIKIFSNIEWIRNRFADSYLRFIDDIEKSDMCILNKDYRENKIKSDKMLVIRTYDSEDTESIYINEEFIVNFLNFIERFESQKYGVGMVGFSDIKEVARGKLVKYFNSDIYSETIEDNKQKFVEVLDKLEDPSSMLLYYSQKELTILWDFAKIIEDKFSNIKCVVMTPAKKNNDLEQYMELYVFKE